MPFEFNSAELSNPTNSGDSSINRSHRSQVVIRAMAATALVIFALQFLVTFGAFK